MSAPIRSFGVVIVGLWMFSSTPTRAEDGSPPPVAATDAKAGRAARVAGWASIALGSEAAVVAIATSVLVVQEKGVRDGECNAAKVCSQRGVDASGTIASLSAVNTAAWIVAAAGIGVGAVLLLTHRSDTGGRTAIAVSPTAGGVGVGVWGTF